MDRADAIGLAQLAAIIGLCFEVLAVSVGGLWPDPGIPLFMSVSFIAGAGVGALVFGILLWVRVRISDRDTMIVDGNLRRKESPDQIDAMAYAKMHRRVTQPVPMFDPSIGYGEIMRDMVADDDRDRIPPRSKKP